MAFRGSKEEEADKNPFTGAAVDMRKVIEFVETQDAFLMKAVGALLMEPGALPTDSPGFYHPIQLVDTSLEALVSASSSLWLLQLQRLRTSFSAQLPLTISTQFPLSITNQPSITLSKTHLYLALTDASQRQVYIYRCEKSTQVETSLLLQFSRKVLHAEMYLYSREKLLIVQQEANIILALCDLSAVAWENGASATSVQVVELAQQRTLDAVEFVRASVSQDRGLATLLLGDRTLLTIDLEDSEN